MATEVPSCSQTAPNTDDISIFTFIKKNSDEEYISNLYQEWNTLLEEQRITETLRRVMDSWFLEVYNSRNSVKTMEKEQLLNMLQETENELYNSFKLGIENKIHEAKTEPDAFIKFLNLQRNLQEVESNWSPLEWVKNAVKCVEKEAELIRKYSRSSADIEMCEAEKKMDGNISSCDSLNKDLENYINNLEHKLGEIADLDTWISQRKENLDNFEILEQNGKIKNGLKVNEKKKFQNDISGFMERRHKVGESIWEIMTNLNKQICSIVATMEYVVGEVEREIKEWKKQFQFDYAQIMANPQLERVAPWCEKMGKLLEVAKGNFLKANKLYCQAGAEEKWGLECQPQVNKLLEFQYRFFHNSFVVVEQEDFVIKVDKKNFPKISVRFLAAEGLDLSNCKVQAHFVYEDYIQLKQDGSLDLDLDLLREKEKKIKGEVSHFNGNQRGKMKETFSGMQFKDKDFTRGESANNKMIHEQKYRIVFTTNFKGQTYWTLSLPLVVTTGANQGCRALASVMWQCFGTDVYQVPIVRRDELPWCEIAQMVDQKFRRLCPKKGLSEENLAHLKNRMFGGAHVPDDELVSLNKFCYDKMYNNKDDPCFTFWKWFLANYNLLEKYLLDYWKNGLIEGFLSKEDCQRKFKMCGNHKSGLFILRFSDQHIDDSQGIKNIFGHLVAEVSTIKVAEDGQKKRSIYHLDVAGHKTLKSKNLANILKETEDKHHNQIYQYIFPGTRTREQAFDGYCTNGNIVEGYEGPHDAFIVDLEHAICKLELSTGKHRSQSQDSGFEASSPLPCTAGKIDSKRMKSVENAHPTLTKMLSTKSVGSPAMSDMSHLSSPQPSPAFSAASPAESRGKYMSDVLIHQQPSPGTVQILDPPDQMNLLPKFDHLHSDTNGRGYTGNTRNRNNSTHSQVGNQAGLQNNPGIQDGSSGVGVHNNNMRESSPPNEIIIEEGVVPPGESFLIYVNEAGSNFQTSSANQMPTTNFTNQNSHIGLANQNVCLMHDQYQLEQQPGDCNQQLLDLIRNLTPEQQNQIFQQLQVSQQRTEVINPEPVQVAMCTDNNPDDIQAVNSSGSLFNFNTSEISEANQMDSGSIDPNVLDTFGDDPQSY